MARVEIPMPQMGESIAEGTVSVWMKQVGDRVERDEPIMEISTDKVDAEIPSPVAGTLVEVVAQEGQTVEVGTVVAYIDTAPSAGSEGVVTAPPPPEAPAAPEAPATATPGPEPSAAASIPLPADRSDSLEVRLRSRSSPLVRRIAEENGVDLTRIAGSGRLGRVTKDDILAYLEAPEHAAGTRRDHPGHEIRTPSVVAGPGDRVEPMSRMTRIIAENMVLSRRVSPHVHSYFEIDYSRVDQLRARRRTAWAEQGIKVTYTHFIAWAVSRALREHPKINASISGTDVIYRANVTIGIAVALEDGLIVPVVRNADDLSLVGLAKRIDDLAARARSKRLSPEEARGGTFTITNPGVFGTTLGFPIINQPQVAILAVGAVELRPAVIEDDFGAPAIVARRRGFLALGYDHRLVNGADGDRFLSRVRELLEGFPEDA
jgi:2-oxoglutarate dehydrogenase E2 component (dihydrolipoamide succinyltransferase)